MSDVIFMAGFPRSGTTWFANLINSHEKVIYRHELIGRNHTLFGESVFKALKFNCGLSEQEYASFLKTIEKADISTDRPPFFSKDFGYQFSPNIHQLAFLSNKALPFIGPLYRYLFTVSAAKKPTYLLKETRNLLNVESILKGIRPRKIIFLVRHPHGSIASHMKGIAKGVMASSTAESRKSWFTANAASPFLTQLGLVQDDFSNMSEIDFMGLKWSVYHEEALRLKSIFPDKTTIYSYEEFLTNTEERVKSLFKELALSYSDKVSDFVQQSMPQDNSGKSIIRTDASNEYYSVYRGSEFNPHAWKDSFDDKQVDQICKYTDKINSKIAPELELA